MMGFPLPKESNRISKI